MDGRASRAPNRCSDYMGLGLGFGGFPSRFSPICLIRLEEFALPLALPSNVKTASNGVIHAIIENTAGYDRHMNPLIPPPINGLERRWFKRNDREHPEEHLRVKPNVTNRFFPIPEFYVFAPVGNHSRTFNLPRAEPRQPYGQLRVRFRSRNDPVAW